MLRGIMLLWLIHACLRRATPDSCELRAQSSGCGATHHAAPTHAVQKTRRGTTSSTLDTMPVTEFLPALLKYKMSTLDTITLLRSERRGVRT